MKACLQGASNHFETTGVTAQQACSCRWWNSLARWSRLLCPGQWAGEGKTTHKGLVTLRKTSCIVRRAWRDTEVTHHDAVAWIAALVKISCTIWWESNSRIIVYEIVATVGRLPCLRNACGRHVCQTHLNQDLARCSNGLRKVGYHMQHGRRTDRGVYNSEHG